MRVSILSSQAYVVVFSLGQAGVGGDKEPQELTFARIQQNVIGVLSFVIVEVAVWRKSASELARAKFLEVLRALESTAGNLYSGSLGSDSRGSKGRGTSDSVFPLSLRLRHLISEFSGLLMEANKEPRWASKQVLHGQADSLPYHSNECRFILVHLDRAIDALVSEEARAESQQFLSGNMEKSLCKLDEEIRRRIDGIIRGVEGFRVEAEMANASTDLSRALHGLQTSYLQALSAVRKEYLDGHREDLLQNRTLLASTGLIFLSKHFVHTLQELGRQSRAQILTQPRLSATLMEDFKGYYDAVDGQV